jgi:soluble lytic murein transglycosylase-like protein
MVRRAHAMHCGSPRGGRRRAIALSLILASLAALTAVRAESDSVSFTARYSAVDESAPEANREGPRMERTTAPAEPPASPGAPPAATDLQTRIRALIAKEASQQGLAPAIAEAVTAVESGFNPNAVGAAGEIGLMQILPSTARLLGFAGSNAELAVPENNVHFGVTYLAQAWRLAGGDLCTAVMKYRAGHGETRFSYLSVDYCLAVRSKLAARGFPITGSVPVPTFGESSSTSGRCGRKSPGGGGATRVGRVDLAALNSKLSAVVLQARGGH